MGGKSATAAKAKAPDRRALCGQLLALRIRYAEALGEMDSLKASLIELATEAGDGFREVFPNEGRVTVAGCKPPEFKAHKPEVDPKIFDALSEVKRQKLIDAGIIKITPVYSRHYYGRVDLKVFQGT